MDNNLVKIKGKFVENAVFSQTMCGAGCYKTTMEVKRLSGVSDYLPIRIYGKLDLNAELKGNMAEVIGEFRSRNVYGETRNHLELYVWAKAIKMIECCDNYENNIVLNGYICKDPTFRLTPAGKRISDLFIAINRNRFRSDYIPCIAREKLAEYASELNVGTHVKIIGRIQSRDYIKNISDKEGETRTVYEVSISSMEVENA